MASTVHTCAKMPLQPVVPLCECVVCCVAACVEWWFVVVVVVVVVVWRCECVWRLTLRSEMVLPVTVPRRQPIRDGLH